MAGLLDDDMQSHGGQGAGLLGALGNNSDMLMALGAGLLGGQGWGGALQSALQAQQTQRRAAIQNLLLRQNLRKDERDFNFRTSEAERAQRNADRTFDLQKQSFGLTDDIKEFNLAKQQGFTGSLQQWMQRKRAGAGDYGPQSIWGRSAVSIR